MGRSPCCDVDAGVKKGPWTPEEDKKLMECVDKHGYGRWRNVPKLAGLNRCSKSCRLRWTNYLRPDIKRGSFSDEEQQLIIQLHSLVGNKYASYTPLKAKSTASLRKKLMMDGIDPVTHMPRTDLNLNLLANLQNNLAAATDLSSCFATNPLISHAIQLQNLQLLQTLVQLVGLHRNQNQFLALNSHNADPQGLMPAKVDGNSGGSFLTNPASSTTSLAAASPENFAVDQIHVQHTPLSLPYGREQKDP